MKKILLFLFIMISLFNCTINSYKPIIPSERVMINYYLATNDYVNKEFNKEPVYVKIKKKSKKHLIVSRFFDANTDKYFMNSDKPWAISYENTNYFNMKYLNNLLENKLYMKFDIEGKICVIFIDKNSPKSINLGDQGYYGGGLLGLALGANAKRANGWKDLNKERHVVLVINTEDGAIKTIDMTYKSMANMLTKKNFNELLGLNYSKETIKKLSFEDVISIINRINVVVE